MKKFKSNMARAIYDLLYYLDDKTGKISEYGYETAPYCGHHFSGHKGRFTSSDYHEGMGGCKAEIGRLWIFKNSEESTWEIGFRK
jgi:hypothetical protein